MTQVIQTFEAPHMSARVIEARNCMDGYSVQYEYAREGRPRLYGGVQTQQWRTVCHEGRGGREGPKTYRTIGYARAAARRIVANNNTNAA